MLDVRERLFRSDTAFHVAFGTQAQEAFLEGHVLAFEHFGGVLAGCVTTTSKPAVVRVMKGRDRTESERFIALRSHYLFDTFSCRPASTALTRRAVSKVRSAGSADRPAALSTEHGCSPRGQIWSGKYDTASSVTILSQPRRERPPVRRLPGKSLPTIPPRGVGGGIPYPWCGGQPCLVSGFERT